MIKIKEFILENEVVVKSWLIENNIVDKDDINDIKFSVGSFEDKNGEIIESDEIVGIEDIGCDFSFKRKFVKDKYGDSSELKIKINNKIVYVLCYNI
jgi:hypothetical protein